MGTDKLQLRDMFAGKNQLGQCDVSPSRLTGSSSLRGKQWTQYERTLGGTR